MFLTRKSRNFTKSAHRKQVANNLVQVYWFFQMQTWQFTYLFFVLFGEAFFRSSVGPVEQVFLFLSPYKKLDLFAPYWLVTFDLYLHLTFIHCVFLKTQHSAHSRGFYIMQILKFYIMSYRNLGPLLWKQFYFFINKIATKQLISVHFGMIFNHFSHTIKDTG